MNATMQGGGYGYELPGAQTWNPNAFGGTNGFSPFGATGRMKSASRGRSILPTVSRVDSQDNTWECDMLIWCCTDLA